LIVLAEVILKIAGNNYNTKFLFPIKYIRGKLNLINTKNSRKRLKKALKCLSGNIKIVLTPGTQDKFSSPHVSLASRQVD
jgi:hypothetical protein